MKQTWSDKEQEIRNLISQIHEFETRQIPSEESLREQYKLSDLFFQKMELLMQKQEKKAKRKKRLRGLGAAAAVFLLLLLILRPQYFVEAGDTIIQWFSDHILFQFKEDTGKTWIPEYEMNYVPEGYSLLESNYYEGMGGFDVYINQDEKSLYFEYGLIDAVLNVDNENKEYIKLKGKKGEVIYYLKTYDNNGESSIIWINHDKTIKFHLSGTLSEKELLNIQQEISLKNKN